METNEQVKKTKKASSLPESQFDLITLAETAADKWLATPQLTLLWAKPTDFKALVTDFRAILNQRVDVGSGRGSQTQTLKDLDTQIDKAVEEVKIAILAKFGKDKGKAYFGEFGITKQGNKLGIPADRTLRLNALPLLVKAVKNHTLKVIGYNMAFFEGLVGDYTAAFQATQSTDSAVAVSVGNKNELRKQIAKILSALKALIKINYPNTYEGELRSWGF